MYEVGSGVCSWYACWKAVVYARLCRPGDGCLRYMADTAGDFYEMFEINNSFRLAAKGGLLVEFSLNDGKIEKLDVYGNEFCKAERVTVHLPEALGGDFEVNVKK